MRVRMRWTSSILSRCKGMENFRYDSTNETITVIGLEQANLSLILNLHYREINTGTSYFFQNSRFHDYHAPTNSVAPSFCIPRFARTKG